VWRASLQNKIFAPRSIVFSPRLARARVSLSCESACRAHAGPVCVQKFLSRVRRRSVSYILRPHLSTSCTKAAVVMPWRWGPKGQVLRHVFLWHVLRHVPSFTCPAFTCRPRAALGAECMCFILTPCTTRGRRNSNVQLGSAYSMMPVYYLASSVAAVGVEGRPPFGDLGCALRHRLALVLRRHPGVAPWLPHERRVNGEGGRGHKFLSPGAVLRQVRPLGEDRRNVEVVQVALKRPALL